MAAHHMGFCNCEDMVLADFFCSIALNMAIPAQQALLNMDVGLLAFLTQSLNFPIALCNCLSFDGYDTTPDFALQKSATIARRKVAGLRQEEERTGLTERGKTFKVLLSLSPNVPWKGHRLMSLP